MASGSVWQLKHTGLSSFPLKTLLKGQEKYACPQGERECKKVTVAGDRCEQHFGIRKACELGLISVQVLSPLMPSGRRKLI